jgi:hypothetical protein
LRREHSGFTAINSPRTGAWCAMDTTLNYAIGIVICLGAIVVGVAFLVW